MLTKAPCLVLVVLLFACGKLLYSQSDSLLAEEWLSCYDYHLKVKEDSLDFYLEAGIDSVVNQFKDRQDSAALVSFNKAIRLFRDAGALDRWLSAQRKHASWISKKNQKPYAVQDYLDQCLQDMGRWRLPKNKEEYEVLCKFYMYKGYIAKQDDENYFHCKLSLEKAYAVFDERLGGDNNTIAAWLLFQLGNSYVRMGEFESARKVFEEGLEYSYKHKVPAVAKYCDHGGMYVAQKKYREALPIFREGLRREGIPEEDVIFTRLGLAACFAKMGAYDEAFRENRIVEAQLNSLPDDSPKLPEFRRDLYENYAIIHFDQNEFIEALPWYQLAMKTDMEYENGSNRQVAYYLLDIGNVYFNINQPDFALLSYHKALETIIPGFKVPSNQNPEPSTFLTENIIYKALEGKARCFEQLDSLDKALECYELIPVVEAKLRAAHDYESSSLRALQDSRIRIDKAIDVAWRLSNEGANTAYTRRAFALMEHARAIILMEQLTKSRATDQLPDSLKVQEYELRSRIAWYERERAEEHAKPDMDSTRYKQLDDDLFSIQRKLKDLQQKFPPHAQSADSLKYIQAVETPALLRPRSALIEYYLSDWSLDVFCITQKGAIYWRREKWESCLKEEALELALYPTWLNEDLGLKNCYIHSAAKMYDLLLKPELSQFPDLESLVIIPDDVLAFLPFEILLTKMVSVDTAFANLPYLIRDQSISYAYSATLLSLQQQHRSSGHTPRKPFGAFTPRYTSGCIDPITKTPLENLDSIQAVTLRIQKLLGVSNAEQVEASEAEFKKKAAQYAVLLLGMHGFADEEQPELSRLVFGEQIPGQKQDNVLHANELEILQLQADLAILLACHTGKGKWRRGEGVYSLARAFTLAGVPATLMSLWSLPDNSTPPLMQVYFEKLKSGMTKDEALKEAKLAYLAADDKFDLAHPFYWAGLMTIGNTKPLYPALHPALLATGIGALLILLVWLLRRYFRNGGQPGAHPSYWKRFAIRRQSAKK